jgi:hypothetical protein
VVVRSSGAARAAATGSGGCDVERMGALVVIGVVVVMTAEEENDDVATAAGGCFALFNAPCMATF